MENVVGEIRVVVGERPAHIIAFVAAGFHEFLELRHNGVVTALTVDCLTQAVVDFFSPV